MKISLLRRSIFRSATGWVKFALFIGVSIGLLMFFIWIGWKGIIGLVTGMFFMAYLLLSKNRYLKWVIDLTSSDKYLWEMMGDTNGKEKDHNSRN